MPENLYSVDEVAEYLRLNPKTIRNWMALRRIEFVQVGGSRLVRESELQRIIHDGTVPVGGDAK